MKDNTLVIIDSHALIYRAYYAYPPNLKTIEGESINAVFGFTNLLLEVINKFTPSNIIAVLDSDEPVERQSSFTQYKANRDKTDELLINQIPRIEEVIKSFGIPIYKIGGIEADDIIATIDHKFAPSFSKTIIITGDQDLFQLVDEDTFIYLAGRKFSESKLFDSKQVYEKLGITPIQIPDYKALAGDPSDNIPGVKGIGGKTASDLIGKFQNLEGIYANLDKIAPKVVEKLINDSEISQISKDLATAKKEIPLSIDISDSKFKDIDIQKINNLFKELNFRSLQTKLDKFISVYNDHIINNRVLDTPNEKSIEIKEWSGEVLDNMILIDYEIGNIANDPLHWEFSKIYIKSGKHIFFINRDFKELLEKLKDRKLVLVNFKNFAHLLLNNGFDFKEFDIKDIGIHSSILSGGQTKQNFSSIFHFFKMDFSGDRSLDLNTFNEIQEIVRKDETDQSLKKLYLLEFEIQKIVINMEREGIRIDKNFFIENIENFKKKKELLQKEIFKSAGHEFNIGSPKQVGVVLYEEKRLPVERKTKSGAHSTDERALKNLLGVDPIIEQLLSYREIDKILNTYLITIPDYVNSKTGKIHAIFDSLGTVSGRFSSRNPNMQNIPKGEILGLNIRNGFIPEKETNFLSFDYSQQELRILAALSGEESMIKSFNENRDIHVLTASEIFGIPIDEVSPKQRERGKTINFSIIYGISAFGLSDRMKISRAEASIFIKKYFENYPKVKEFMEISLQNARENGFTETILGRRRYDININSNNRNLRSASERELFNFIIQGSAADIMKLAMVEIDKILDENIKLILQIHDEFLFEIRENKDDKISKLGEKIKKIMTEVYPIGVKYKVEGRYGAKWGNLVNIIK